MRIVHPDLPGQSAEVTERQFELVWAKRGWTEADELPDLTGKSIKQVVEAVGDDQAAAVAALTAERAQRREPRKGLVEALTPIAFPDQTPDPDAQQGDDTKEN